MGSYFQPLDTNLCRDYEQENFQIRYLDLNNLGTAGFLTEWGAYSTLLPDSKEYKDGVDILVCVCVCVCVCMCMCTCACVCVCACVCILVCLYTTTYIKHMHYNPQMFQFCVFQ